MRNPQCRHEQDRGDREVLAARAGEAKKEAVEVGKHLIDVGAAVVNVCVDDIYVSCAGVQHRAYDPLR